MAKLVRDDGVDGIRRGVAVRDVAVDSDSIADRGVGVDFRRIRQLKMTEMAKRSNVVAAAVAAAGGLAKWMTTTCCVGRLT